jgi:hypothetical protein
MPRRAGRPAGRAQGAGRGPSPTRMGRAPGLQHGPAGMRLEEPLASPVRARPSSPCARASLPAVSAVCSHQTIVWTRGRTPALTACQSARVRWGVWLRARERAGVRGLWSGEAARSPAPLACRVVVHHKAVQLQQGCERKKEADYGHQPLAASAGMTDRVFACPQLDQKLWAIIL